ncbi:MAG TPA: hypothetical protein VJX29_01565 [Candidatus Acidoferrales bacterium]|nr:hypothetical protein [Candidatus Acidoferrales bacterium]
MDDKHPSGAPSAYEKRDANPRSLLRFGLGLFLTLVVAWGASKWIFDYFRRVQSLGPTATPFEQARALPPLPQLQVHPVEDLERLRQQQEKSLDTYGWVDRSRGIVHIPIERAMDLVLERGLPARPAAPPLPGGGPPNSKVGAAAAAGGKGGGT